MKLKNKTPTKKGYNQNEIHHRGCQECNHKVKYIQSKNNYWKQRGKDIRI